MITFPNCKINLGLNVTRKRQDGYHDLETVFFPVEIKDALEVITADDPQNDIEFTSTGLEVAGDPRANLCVKAYYLLKKDFPSLPAVRVHLHKAIPMGAGLGGGSADGAFMLRLLDARYQLSLTQEQLLAYALQLGSDCPFFIYNKPCFATGRGEILEPVSLDLSSYQVVLINPGIHISTAFAFSNIIPAEPLLSVKNVIQLPVNKWKEQLVNDFEKGIAAAHPEISLIKEAMYAQGAVYASMTGSGSTVYGLFPGTARPVFSLQSTYRIYYTK